MKFGAALFQTILLVLIINISAGGAEEDDTRKNLRRRSRRKLLLKNGNHMQADENGNFRIYVQYEKGHDRMQQLFTSTMGCKIEHDFFNLHSFVMTVDETRLRMLENEKNVILVEEDPKRYKDHIITEVSNQEHITAVREEEENHRNLANTNHPGLYGLDLVQAKEAWKYSTGDGVSVCVIDSGFDSSHPAFDRDNISGFNNVVLPWNRDGDGHGTHVTGTIAAKEFGVAKDADIYVVRVFNDNGSWAYSSGLVDAAERCVAAGANIISMSLGGTGRSTTEEQAFADIGLNTLVIAAAGNGGANARASYPASYNGVLSVAAVDRNERVASFSQRNAFVDVAGPGVSIYSTFTGNRYRVLSGTSMATPHVSAVAAVMWSFALKQQQGTVTPSRITQALLATAKDLGQPGRDDNFGHGLAQAYDGLMYLNNGAPLPPPEDNPPEDNPPPENDDEDNAGRCEPGSTYFRADLQTDRAGWQTSTRLTRSDGATATRGPFGSNREYRLEYCLVDTLCYEFAVRDLFWNGMREEGQYKLVFGNNIIRVSQGDFRNREITLFGISSQCESTSSAALFSSIHAEQEANNDTTVGGGV